MRIVDLSHPLSGETPPFPGDSPLSIDVLETTETEVPPGRPPMNLSRILMSLHAGTHMDAPFHFVGGAAGIDQIPLEQCTGPAMFLNVAAASIEPMHLEPHRDLLQRWRKVIFNTGWHKQWGQPEYFTAYPVIAEDAAILLVGYGVHLVGVDAPSVDRAPYKSHQALLNSRAVIVENLANLDAVPEGVFELIALPLRIAGRDGSPIRAVAAVP